jgi:hypothetical protein
MLAEYPKPLKPLRSHKARSVSPHPITSPSLLPVEIEEAWSDQIKDVEVNGLPDKTGLAEKPYILMGARADSKGHGHLKLGSALPEDIRDRVLFRFYRGGQVQAGSSTYEQNGSIVRVQLDSIVNVEDKDYTIVVGFDKNEDGELQNEEAVIHPGLTYDEENKIPITYKIVGQDRYNDSKTHLQSYLDNIFVDLGVTQAARLLDGFVKGEKPRGGFLHGEPVVLASNIIEIPRNEEGLTHPVGIAFTAIQNPGESIEINYASTDSLTEKVVESTSFYVFLQKKLREKEEVVRRAFEDFTPQNAPPQVIFTWPIQGSFDFKNPTDLDLYLALNKVEVETVAHVTVHISGQVTSIILQGKGVDLYDFDHDNVAFGLDLPKRAAKMQAGHPTLGPGGRVFKNKVNFSGNEVMADPDRRPFEFFK